MRNTGTEAECGAAVDSMRRDLRILKPVQVAEFGMIFILNLYSVLYLRAP